MQIRLWYTLALVFVNCCPYTIPIQRPLRLRKSKEFLLLRTTTIDQRACTCSTSFSCSCCETVTLIYSKTRKTLCSNFMYQRNGLNVDISLNMDTLKMMTVTVYRPFKLCTAIPGSLFSSICVNVVELNEFPRSITVCVRHEIVSKFHEWQINYTCVSISTTLPMVPANMSGQSGMASMTSTTAIPAPAASTSKAPMPMMAMMSMMPMMPMMASTAAPMMTSQAMTMSMMMMMPPKEPGGGPPGQMGTMPPPGGGPPGQMGAMPPAGGGPPGQMGTMAPGGGPPGQMGAMPPPGQMGAMPPAGGAPGQMGAMPPAGGAPGQMGAMPPAGGAPGQMGAMPPAGGAPGQMGAMPPAGGRPPGQMVAMPPTGGGPAGQMGAMPPPGQMGAMPPAGGAPGQMGAMPPAGGAPGQMSAMPPSGGGPPAQMGAMPPSGGGSPPAMMAAPGGRKKRYTQNWRLRNRWSRIVNDKLGDPPSDLGDSVRPTITMFRSPSTSISNTPILVGPSGGAAADTRNPVLADMTKNCDGRPGSQGLPIVYESTNQYPSRIPPVVAMSLKGESAVNSNGEDVLFVADNNNNVLRKNMVSLVFPD